MPLLGIGKKKQEKKAQAAQATIDKILAAGGPLSEYDKQMMVFASDGKISTKEKKLLKKMNKQSAKTDRVEVRQLNRTDRTSLRADARKTAYANGIDPNRWIADGVGNIARGVVGVASANALGSLGRSALSQAGQGGGTSIDNLLAQFESKLGALADGVTASGLPDYGPSNSYQFAEPGGDKTHNAKMLMIAAAGVVLLLLFTGKKRR